MDIMVTWRTHAREHWIVHHICGKLWSSVATAATVGTVAYPEIEARGYNERLFLGSLAAGGTIGILVPPH